MTKFRTTDKLVLRKEEEWKRANGEQAKKLDNILGFGRSLVEVETERGLGEALKLLK